MTASEADLTILENSLLNKSGDVPLHHRFRALFTLKALKTEEAVRIISAGFQDTSALLKHELAYCLGQMKNTSALAALEAVLRDESEDPMVRHEAAEAMGAISASASLPILREYLADSNRSVRETCEIAIAKIEWDNSEEGRRHAADLADSIPLYTSTDPAPPSSGLLNGTPKPEDVSDLLDTRLSLFERYRAMFALRNIGTPAAVDALAAGFSDDSALFKHEIAFVLQNTHESEMVRHEAAEALGGIGTPEVLPHLKEWMNREDAPLVVRQSCEVAIDLWEHENSDEFQYANGLGTATPIVSVS
ncbi:armadillo-type protein [Roridomyces roridus]|uniref:Deoxyhypusine hydroxylase n=1 Tax=Roridomyces roridus TaxID=1738132 RepID=A0AAD7CAX5_9AGAR|nr:armadillo-type protein [Roridomyces roridus]